MATLSTFFDMVYVNATETSGHGPFMLGTAVTGFQTAAAAGITNGTPVSYKATDGTNWETAHGVIDVSGSTYTLTRGVDTIKSSNSNALVNFGSGVVVCLTELSQDFVSMANPTAVVGLTAVNGSATSAMRSDGAPALDLGITPTWTDAHIFSKTTPSTSTTTGALIVAGGVGIGGAVSIGGALGINCVPTGEFGALLSITGKVSTTSLGVAGVAANLVIDYQGAGTNYYDGRHIFRTYAGVNLIMLNSADAMIYASGQAGQSILHLSGVAANIYVDYGGGGNTYIDAGNVFYRTFAGALYATLNATGLILAQTTNSTSTATGALTVAGGVGIAGALNVGTNLWHPTSANASVATVLGSVGPTGSHTTVQEWFPIKNASGTIRYVPGF